jgi:nitrogen fixation/metabolism regulation signal transduction histidine kinase
VREALRVAPGGTDQRSIAAFASDVGAPFFLYRDAQLVDASDPVLDAIAPIGRLLPETLGASEEDFGVDGSFASRRVQVRDREALIGYRQLTRVDSSLVLATPARGNEFALDARREDLGMLVLFATALGVLAAIWSSGIAARALSRPVGSLREAALALASGRQRPELGVAPASEFAPVYRAFTRMAEDLSASRAELESARRRTEAVLQNVASGVLAVRNDGTVMLANPRAEQLLHDSLRKMIGDFSIDMLPQELEPIVARTREFLQDTTDEDSFELTANTRQLRLRLTRIAGGAVLTLDDVTELASAQRILAWGEMARQVAHEIKNPLTPIRLGVQHLRRAFRDGRGDYSSILETNVAHVLAEIDRLDEIARAFSRYGTAPADRAQPVAVDVTAVARDVVALEKLGEDGVQWSMESSVDDGEALAYANSDELKEVLLNLLENARLADSTEVRVAVSADPTEVLVSVTDNGSGIAAEVLPRIFEPHFSTRTSGSGLGLAISRRLIESWGGTITAGAAERHGTVVHISLRRVKPGN